MAVLSLMIQPARTNRNITFGRNPVASVSVTLIQPLSISPPGGKIFSFKRSPVRIAGDPAFVSRPPDIGAGVAEDTRVRLVPSDQLPGVGPVVVGVAINNPLFSS